MIFFSKTNPIVATALLLTSVVYVAVSKKNI